MLCALIMAGGKGERFWPLSTEEKPKQFLNLLGTKSMIQITVERMEKLIPIERIFVVTGEKYVDLVEEQIPNIPKKNIIVEPIARNTAPCIALSALIIDKYYKDSTMLVVPSDHLIVNEDIYINVVKSACEFIEKKQQAIVTIGINPDRAETGYGYMKTYENSAKCLKNNLKIYEVDKFAEKPSLEKAQQYLDEGNYVWNSGMFVWKTKHILELTKKHLKNTFEVLNKLREIEPEKFEKMLYEEYQFVDNVSVDYGIMEKSQDIYVIPASFGWDDIGTWRSVERNREKDVNNNVCVGDIKNIESSNNIIMGNAKPIVVVGLNDIFVAETDKVIFVGNKQYIDNIKEIKNKLQSSLFMKGGKALKKALITGITGQDGAYLTEFLLNKGYEVHGIIRRASTFNTKRIDYLFEDPNIGNKTLFLHHGDLTDSSNLNRILEKVKPDEIYNLAAQSHVQVSFEVPEYTAETDGIGTLRILDAIKESGLKCKFYQASTSELFGGLPETAPQSEKTPFYPRSPYAVAKLYAYWVTINYREAYNLFACNGILFNHESPRRGETFVTRKITRAVASIIAGKLDKLSLGNLDSKRDWGFAGDYVEAMWLMLQQDKSTDYVIATGETHTVREFVEIAFKEVGMDIKWTGKGVEEKGIDKDTGKVLVEVNPRYFRPTEVEVLLGDPRKAEKELGWKRKVGFKELVHMMIKHDLKEIAGVDLNSFIEAAVTK